MRRNKMKENAGPATPGSSAGLNPTEDKRKGLHILRLGEREEGEDRLSGLRRRNRRMARLVSAVQELSLARDLNAIMAVVRRAAREMTGADGATFVLREGDFCHYADEDAIAPLWKGKRFPMQDCISGWVMRQGQPVVIEDIYSDPRIPTAAYRPTFVKSLAMVPIRPAAPLGAIGNYWATRRQPSADEVELLQALANTTAVAMENAQVYAELEHRVKLRTQQLQVANQELESFSYAVAHDLSAPLRAVRGFSELLLAEHAGELDPEARDWLERIRTSSGRMSELIGDLLRLSKYSRGELRLEQVNLSELARETVAHLSAGALERRVTVDIAEGMEAQADKGLLRVVLENLLSNAWKYSSKRPDPRVRFASLPQPDGSIAFYVRDNGAGFDMKFAQRLFQPFQRLHSANEFPGNGVGLATVQRIIHRHGGRIWAEAEEGQGATFYFTL